MVAAWSKKHRWREFEVKGTVDFEGSRPATRRRRLYGWRALEIPARFQAESPERAPPSTAPLAAATETAGGQVVEDPLPDKQSEEEATWTAGGQAGP